MGIIQTTKTLRPRQKNDFYPTPIELCRAAVKLVAETHAYFGDIQLTAYHTYLDILDPGCGTGVWGLAAREIWPESNISGIDIENRVPVDYNPYAPLYEGDYLSFKFPKQHDLIIGNPPYKLAEEFIRKSRKLLTPTGKILFLLRLNFLEGQKRGAGLWKEFQPNEIHVCCRRPSYTGNGKTDATAYMICIWDNSFLARQKDPTLHWLEWDYD